MHDFGDATIPPLLERAVRAFREHFDGEPSRAALAPGRVNLIGEHTDYNEGFVMPLAIDRYTLMAARENHSQRCRLVADDLGGETATFINDETLAPGKTAWPNYVKGVIAQFIANGHHIPSFDAVICSTVPVGSGLSSSAALEVATATLLESFLGIRLDADRKARWCQRAENDFVGLPCGIMDMTASAMGRRDHALMIDCRSQQVTYVPLTNPDVAVLVANTNVKHELSGSEYPIRRAQCEQAAGILHQWFDEVRTLRDATLRQLDQVQSGMDPVIYRRARHIITENQRVQEAARALQQGEYETAGFLMNESHRFLRDDYEVSCRELDVLVEAAQRFGGVFGSRMTGGGFGGCTVTLARAHVLDDLMGHLRRTYLAETGLEATCFRVQAADGARAIPLSVI